MHWLGSLVLLATAGAVDRYAPIVDEILKVWEKADVVCLGEDHGRKHDSDLRIAIVRDPRFPRSVQTIVVEFANPVHQQVLDQFVLEGRSMSREELAVVWRDTTGVETWESPIYEAFFRAVQDVNKRLAKSERVRVIGGDSAIDWSKIKRAEQLVPLINRGGNIRKIIAEQVLDPKIKALAIYGSGHCEKRGRGFPGELEDRYPGRMWSASSFYGPDGVAEGRHLFGLGKQPQILKITGTERAKTPAGKMFYNAAATLGNLFDAIIYHGNVTDIVVPADSAELKKKYGAELERRGRLTQEAFELWRHRKQ
jgi:hypothetical protein